MNFVIRPAEASDFDALRELYSKVWGYSRPIGFDRWRYLTPPDGACPMMLAIAGDRLAGAYTIWPVRNRIGDEIVLGAQSMDTMTHPDFQGQGVFTKLAQACFALAAERGFRLIYGFPNPSSYPGFVRRLEFPHVTDVMHWIRPILPSRHPKIPAAFGGLADTAARLWPIGSSRGYDIVRARPKQDLLGDLLADYRKNSGLCCIERTADWLDWRYSPDAENNYRWVAAYRAQRLVALAVWGMRSHNWGGIADNRAHLVELVGDDVAALGAVLATVIRDAREARALLLETVCNLDRPSAALRVAGFLRHRKTPLIVKSISSSPFSVDVLDGKNWRIMGGDVDTF